MAQVSTSVVGLRLHPCGTDMPFRDRSGQAAVPQDQLLGDDTAPTGLRITQSARLFRLTGLSYLWASPLRSPERVLSGKNLLNSVSGITIPGECPRPDCRRANQMQSSCWSWASVNLL